jgi:asparagine synthetase B (glutamine-hydrolysing)
MCGILVYKNKGNNFFIQKRGQDLTSEVKKHGFTFVHNLLSITGKLAPQPYIEGDIFCLYNGEIYNHKYLKSDGENIIPLYKQYGFDFPKHLDGEWAIALYDFEKELAVLTTDLFATKPLWRKGLECGSYESGVGGHKIPANTIEIVYFDGAEETRNIYEWELNQHKNTYDDWICAFEAAVKKRALKNCFLGVSSGYDSGAISCALLKQKTDFKAYIIEAREDKEVLKKRMKLIKNHQYLGSTEVFRNELPWIKNNIEDFKYKIPTKKSFKNDSAALGLSRICRLAHGEGRKVYLSGQGSDEIIADYALWPYQSTFKGKFPKKLTPQLWENFYNGCQYSYLGKEEYVAGSHSIETRYPFLDKNVVQEFLWLTPELKNRHYKAPVHEYLTRNNFPFAKGVKIGLYHLR